MENYHALIAMRAGSKRFPGKHLAITDGTRICEIAVRILYTLGKYVQSINVATDEKDVIAILKEYPSVKFFKRSKATATDNAKVETCVKEFLQAHSDIQHLIFFPGANSSWITSSDLVQAIDQYERTKAASLITLAPLKRYLYERDLKGWINPLFPDTYRRGFLGNLPPVWIENGAFYIFNAEEFLKHESFRMEPCTGFVMDKETERELDTKTDLAVINAVKSCLH